MPNEPELPSPSPPSPPLPIRWPGLRFLIAAIPWSWFVVSHLSDPLGRDPRSLILLFLLTPPLVYTALSLGRRLSGEAMSGKWRVLFLLLGFLATIPALRAVSSLAESAEVSAVRRVFEPVISEVQARQSKTGRPPVELEALLRLHLPDMSEASFRLRRVTYYFDDREWALQTSGVPMDRDDTASITITGDGRSIRRDSGSDGGYEGSERLLAAALPFLAQARRCPCMAHLRGGDGAWRCARPCGAGLEGETPEPSTDASPSLPPFASPSPGAPTSSPTPRP